MAVDNAYQLRVAAFYRTSTHRFGHTARPHLGDDARGYHHSIVYGAYLLVGIYARRSGLSALLRPVVAVQLLDVGTCGSDEYLPDVHLLGAGRRIVVLAHRLLLPETFGSARLEKSIYRNAFRRLGLLDRHTDTVVLHQDIRLRYTDSQQRRTCDKFVCRRYVYGYESRIGSSGSDIYGRSRQIGNVPAAYLAARRHGGSYSRFGTDTRRHYGCCRCLSGSKAFPRIFLRRSRCAYDDSLYRSIHGTVCGGHSYHTDRYQTCLGILYNIANSLYDGSPRRIEVWRPRRIGIYGIYVSPLYTRLLQGTPVPRSRLGDTRRTLQRDERYGQSAQIYENNKHHIPHRLFGNSGHTAVFGLLLQRRDIGSGFPQPADSILDSVDSSRTDGILYVPPIFRHILQRQKGL